MELWVFGCTASHGKPVHEKEDAERQ